jgi:hypothetical protein
MSSDDDQKTFTGDWGTATIHEDGSFSADHQAATIETSDDGTPRITLKKLTKFRIDNIIDVQSHMIKRDDTATSHHIVLHNGAEARFSYRADGKLLEFSVSNMSVNITPEGVVTVGLLT